MLLPTIRLKPTVKHQRPLTTWHPPAVPPATSSHVSLILPVSGSIARDLTKSLTVSLMAFSGATPCNIGTQPASSVSVHYPHANNQNLTMS